MKINRIELRGGGHLWPESIENVTSGCTINIEGVIEAHVHVSGVDAHMDDIKLSRRLTLTVEGKTLVVTLGPTRGVANMLRLAAEVLEARENE